MKEQNLIELKERYWNGETSVEEDQSLRAYYQDHTDSEDALGALFAYYEQQRQITYNKPIVEAKKSGNIISMRMLMSIAASLVLLVSAYFALRPQTLVKQDVVIEDPMVAWQITQDAFALLNGKVSKSTDVVKHGINHLDKTLIFKNDL